MNLQMPACPSRRAPKRRMGSSLSCRIWWSWTRATMQFSSHTVRLLMVAMKVTSVLPLRLPPALRVRSLRNCSSQHSKSCMTISLPWILVAALYSDQRDWKYDQSSLVPAGNRGGRLTFSTWGVVAVLGVARVAWSVACRFRREAATIASTSYVT